MGEEANCLNYIFEDGFITKIMQLTKNRISLQAIKILLAHICFDNEEISKKCINFLFVKLGYTDLTSYPIYLEIIEAIILLQDKFQIKRVELFTKKFMEILEKNLKDSYIPCNDSISMFLRVATKCKVLSDLIKEKPNLFLNKWLDSQSYPVPGEVIENIILVDLVD